MSSRMRIIVGVAAIAAVAVVLSFIALCCNVPQERHYAAEAYCLDLEIGADVATDTADDGFKVLQITDTHIAAKDAQDKQFAFLDLIIRDADADFIMVTGDLFTYANKSTATRFFEFLDSYGLPWTVTFGNHDEQCYFSIDWLTAYLNDYGSNCVFLDLQDDDVFGNANFVINLRVNGALFDQMIVMDSNRYYFGEYSGYDWFKQSQIDWYARVVEYTTQENGGDVLPSLLFYHIPLPETTNAWDACTTKALLDDCATASADGAEAIGMMGTPDCEYISGEMREGVSAPKFNSGFFTTIQQLGSTRAMFFGHDHRNNFVVRYQGIIFAYGITSTDRIYADKDMMGGRVITLHGDHSLSFCEMYHTDDELG